MIDTHITGVAALVLALTAFVHAASAALPKLMTALKARADSARLDSETRAHIEAARRAAEDDLRARLTRADEELVAAREEMKRRDDLHAIEIGTLRGQLAAMREELDDVRRSITAGHSHA